MSKFGVLQYAPKDTPPVWIEVTYGDGPPLESMKAEIATLSGYNIRYQYKALSEDEHVGAYKAVIAFLSAADLMGTQPNNSFKPNTLRGVKCLLALR